MKIGVVSDTHRNKGFLNDAVEWLISNRHITCLYHLGDDYEDVSDLMDKGIEIVQVPGIYHQRYHDGTLPKTQVENIQGLRIVLVHSLDKDITREDRTVTDIILYGHTHKPEIKLIDGLLLMNPGHMKSHIDKTVEPSFGLLDIQDKSVTATIFDLQYREVKKVKLMKSESGLFRTS